MCIIIGDSIAVGVAQAAQHCTKKAHTGWTSTQWDATYPKPIVDGLVVISLGTNDTRDSNTRAHLEAIRSRITSKQVIWILPHGTNPKSGLPVGRLQGWVRAIAEANGDRVITPKHYADSFHPTGTEYSQIAHSIKN